MTKDDAPLCLKPIALTSPLQRRLPEGTVDTHFHVFKQGAPLNTPRSYTPQILTIADWQAYAHAVGISRGVLVQPSVYGTDNAVLLEALSAHPDQLRGIVVIPAETSKAEFQSLDALGVRGVRINLRNKAGIGLDALTTLAPKIRALDWHVQFQIGPESIATVAELVKTHALTGVIDHLAFMALDPGGADLLQLQRALDAGRILVKISAPYRLRDTDNHDGYRAVIARLAANHADRLLWASDWPHTELFDTMPSEAEIVDLSLAALPADTQDRVFRRNPHQLYWSH